MLLIADRGPCSALLQVPVAEHVRVAFSRLMQSYLDGLHVIVMHPELCLAIEGSSTFSQDEKAAAKKARIKYSDHGALRSQLRHYAVIVDGAADVPWRIGELWHVPLRWLSSRALNATHLVAEDLRDAVVLEGAAEDYRIAGRYQAFKVRLQRVAGGGGNTSRVLRQVAVEDQHPALCIVDSDREFPEGPLGPTAEACAAIDGGGLYRVNVTPGRELENAVPWRLLDILKPDLVPPPSARLAQVEACQPLAARYVDLKRGFVGHDISRLATSSGDYWTNLDQRLVGPATCCGAGCTANIPGNCTRRVVEGFGNATLALVESHLRSTNGQPQRRNAYLPSPNSEDWEQMGRQVFEAGIGLAHRRF